MGSERHTSRDRVHHRLHQDRHPGGAATVPLVIHRDPLRGGRAETPPHRLAQPFNSDVQVRLVQAGVGRIRQILRSARGPHREALRAQTARRRLKESLPPVDVYRGGRDDQAWRDGEPGYRQLAKDTRLPAHPRAVSSSGLGQIEYLGVGVHHHIISSITNYCDATLVVLC